MEIPPGQHLNQEKPRKVNTFLVKNTPRKKFKIFVAAFAFVMFSAGSIISLYLTQINQDIRQQASEGSYTTANNNQEPGNAEFGWNYNTGKPATSEDWTKIYDENGKIIEIAGTYVHCQNEKCERYVVNLPDTHRALEAYSESHKQENAVCIKEVGGVCVAWEAAKPTTKPTAVPTIPKVTSPPPTSAPPAVQCHPDGTLCPNNGLCIATPYGYYCQDLDGVSTNGTKACDHNLLIEYQNGQWKNVSSCENGCRNGQCNPPPIGGVAGGTGGTALKKPGERCNPFLAECSTGCSLTWDGFVCKAEATPTPETTPVPESPPVEPGTKKPGERCNPLGKECSTGCSLTWDGFVCKAEATPTPETTPVPESPQAEPTLKPPGEACNPFGKECSTGCSFVLGSGFICSAEPTQEPPGITVTPEPIPFTDLSLPDWNESCAQTCQSGLKCVNNTCIVDCPVYVGPNAGECNNDTLCEDRSFGGAGNLYQCTNSEWTQKSDFLVYFNDNSCDETEKNELRKALLETPNNLLPSESLKISCENSEEFRETAKGTIIDVFNEGDIEYCGLYLTNTYNQDELIIDIDNEDCLNAGITNSYVLKHELAHNYANETQFWGSASVASFNEAIGCKNEGKGEYSFEETPVTEYGASNCSEAFAELLAVYTVNPCYVKNGDYKNQFNWLINSEDSPYKGKDLCK